MSSSVQATDVARTLATALHDAIDATAGALSVRLGEALIGLPDAAAPGRDALVTEIARTEAWQARLRRLAGQVAGIARRLGGDHPPHGLETVTILATLEAVEPR